MTAAAPCALALQPPMLSLLYSPLASLPFIPLLFLWYSRMVCPFGLYNCIRPTFLVAHPCRKTAPLWRPLPRLLTTQPSCPSSSSQVVHVIALPGLAPPSPTFTVSRLRSALCRPRAPSALGRHLEILKQLLGRDALVPLEASYMHRVFVGCDVILPDNKAGVVTQIRMQECQFVNVEVVTVAPMPWQVSV